MLMHGEFVKRREHKRTASRENSFLHINTKHIKSIFKDNVSK